VRYYCAISNNKCESQYYHGRYYDCSIVGGSSVALSNDAFLDDCLDEGGDGNGDNG